MKKDGNKIQAYVDEKTRLLLAEKAKESSLSTSKYVAQVLTEHVSNSQKDKAYKARILAILANILSCVYDKEACESNADTTQELMNLIKQKCNQAYE